MDNTREKLVEQLRWWASECDRTNFGCQARKLLGEAADYIENGVTVQEWISVKDRLPEESGLYITFGCTAVPVRWLHNFDKDIGKFGAWWNYEPDGKEHPRYRFIEAGNITHWVPMPQPPKGE